MKLVSYELALRTHDKIRHEYGETEGGVRDDGAPLQSALARVEMGIHYGQYKDVIEAAAALWESLTMNHPFHNVNKRTALHIVAMFLRENGVTMGIPLPPEQNLEVIAVFSKYFADKDAFSLKDGLETLLRDTLIG